MTQNPKVSKKTTTTLTVKGLYSGDGSIILPDDEGCMDLLALASMFHNCDVKITIKAEEKEDDEEE